MTRPVRVRSESDTVASPSDPPDRNAFAGRLRRGLEGGLLATLVMTVYRLPVSRSLPPTAEFWTNFVSDGDPQDATVPALLLHAVYGGAAGAVFAALLGHRRSVTDTNPEVDDPPGPPTYSGEVSTTVAGLLYGIVLSVLGERIVLGRFLDIDPDDRIAFHVGHLLYGITLGAWVGTRTEAD